MIILWKMICCLVLFPLPLMDYYSQIIENGVWGSENSEFEIQDSAYKLQQLYLN